MSLSDYAVKYKPYAGGKMKKTSHEKADSKSWFDRCEYKCSLDCSYTAKGRNAITQHLKYTHKEKAKEGGQRKEKGRKEEDEGNAADPTVGGGYY